MTARTRRPRLPRRNESRPQNSPRRRAIAADDTQRQANQIARAGGHASQVEPFDDPDPGTEQDAVSLCAVGEWTNRRPVDPDRTQATRREITGCIRRDRHILLEERSRPCACRVASLEEQSFSCPYSVRLKLVDVDAARISNLDDSRRTYGGVDRPQIDGAPPPKKVQRRVDVRPGMSAHRQRRHGAGIAPFQIKDAFKSKRRIAGPRRHPVSQRHRHIAPNRHGHISKLLYRSEAPVVESAETRTRRLCIFGGGSTLAACTVTAELV
jgi:hypothetical protein